MADGKVNLPDDLFFSKTTDGRSSLRDEASVGDGGEKGIVELHDDSKDQVSLDSSIPLSPQWLYSKPIDAKTSANNTVEVNSTDPLLKDSWHIEGSQDKKDWRRTAPDVNISRRWREEERETSLLGRRDRRKDDRRLEITSTLENKALPSSDRWHDSRGSGHDSRGSGHDSRRENKWSSRWGPEDKEKDSRSDKKSDVEKEDAHVEKQSSGVSHRVGSERDTDSRDKWRPRHRMEAQAIGVATYRAAPGFGLEKGRIECSSVRFPPGRGRANINGNLPVGRPLLGNDGSAPLDKNKAMLGKSSLGVDSYCYPRGKLLDIYRKQKVDQTFENMLSRMEHTSPITQLGSNEPLAFVVPAAEEELVLRDIWRGKITSSEVSGYSIGGKDGGSNDDISGANFTSTKEKQTSLIAMGRKKVISRVDVLNDCDETFIDASSDVGDSLRNIAEETATLKEGKQKDMLSYGVHGRDESYASSNNVGSVCSNNVAEPETYDIQQEPVSALQAHANEDTVESTAALEINSGLPYDSRSRFQFSSLQQPPSINQLDLNEKTYPSESVIPPEELSLCYLDPQGVIQGPFLGIDIILWLEQGFFGVDLPVRPSDAPEGSPFQELGQVIPLLKVKSGSGSGSNLITQSEASDAIGMNQKVNAEAIGYDGSVIIDDQPWPSSQAEATPSVSMQSQIPNQSYSSDINFSGNQCFNSFGAQDDDIALSKMARSCNDSRLVRPADIPALHTNPTGKSGADEVSGSVMNNNEADKMHPFGLLMSELRDSSHLRRAQSSNMSSRMGDQGHFLDSLNDRGAPFPNQSSLGGMVGQPSYKETWSDDYGINRQFSPDPHVGSVDERYMSHIGPTVNNFDVAEFHILQKIAKQRGQQNLTRSDLEEFLEVQRQLELHKQKETHYQRHLKQKELHHQQHLKQKETHHQQHLKHKQMHQNSGSELEEFLELRRQLELHKQKEMHHQQHLTGSDFERFSGFSHSQSKNSNVQQMIRNSGSELEEFLELRRQLELHKQKEMLHQQLYQTLFPEQMKLQQQQESQLRRNILHDLPPNPHSLRHLDPSTELKMIQADLTLNAVQRRQADLSDRMLQARHGNILHSEQQHHFQQEQLQAQQLSLALRQQLGLEGEMQFGRSWPINETAQLLRNPATHQLTHTAGFNASNIHKQQQMLVPQEEQLNYMGRNLAEQNQRGFYDPNSMLFERSAPVSAGALGMNFESVGNSVRGRELQEQLRYIHPTDHLGSLSSHHLQASDDLFAHHSEGFKGFSVNNGHLENSWTDPRLQLQLLESGRQRRELGVTVTSADLDMSASTGTHEDSSSQSLVDLLHHRQSVQSSQPSNIDKWHPLSSRSHDKSWQVSEAKSLIHPFEIPQDQQIHLSDSFVDRPQSANPSAPMQDHFISMHMAEQYNNLGTNGRMPLQSRSGSLVEEQSLLSANKDNLHPGNRNPLLISKSAMENDLLELEVNKGQRHEFIGLMSKSRSGISDFSEQVECTLNPMELPATAHSRHSSLSSSGGDGVSYGRELGLNNSRGDEISSDRMPSTKGFDNALHKRPPVSRALSSPDVQSDQPSVAHANQNNLINLLASNGRREQPSANPSPSISNSTDAQASGKKEVRYRRTSSCSEGSVSETSFMDMLKKPVPPEVDTASGAGTESSDGGSQAARIGKKKGKKGKKPLDPSLLGFVVSSNRIMMGEIHRPED